MKILIEKAVIEQALEAIETSRGQWIHSVNATVCLDTITALREALDPELQFVRDWNEGKVRRVSDGKVMGFAEQAEQEPVAWQGAEEWEPLAFQLCADENGEESCHELLWDGGVIPEPWGERWLKYEDEAKRMIEYVRKYAAPARIKDLTDDEIAAVTGYRKSGATWPVVEEVARAVIAADREKNR